MHGVREKAIIMAPTDWFQNAIIYQLLIDRFAGVASEDRLRPEFLGGNLRAIAEKLPYLEDLGINTLWLSPFCKTSAYHGYHVTDFLTIESPLRHPRRPAKPHSPRAPIRHPDHRGLRPESLLP